MTNSKANFLSLVDFIKLATDFEQESALFYREMQNLELSDSVRQLAELLERQEVAHKKTLEAYEISDAEGFVQFAPEFSLVLPVMEKVNPSLDELIMLALEREKKSKEIYENASKVTSGDLRDLTEALARFEEDHVNRLESLNKNL